ncbi:MAG: sensor histidine kinase [Phycisphaerales bacterium]
MGSPKTSRVFSSEELANHSAEKPPVRERARGVFSGLKIRKKLIVLHTSFSLSLGVLLLVALNPAMGKMVDGAEQDIAQLIFKSGHYKTQEDKVDSLRVRIGTGQEIGLADLQAAQVLFDPDSLLPLRANGFGAGVIGYERASEQFVEIRAQSMRARETVRLIYILVIVTLFAGYAFVAIALELLVLPQHVYSPIRAMLEADDAVRFMDEEHELIPKELISKDELGQIMTSRNETIQRLRSREDELAVTLTRLEAVAIDLHKKNRLLETARKNLEGADRLASLGMMSAGIAHELNTPLSVVKGLVSKLNSGDELSTQEVALMGRVVGRIEILSEGLLDFARVRTPRLEPTKIHELIDEAWLLIKLDRQSVLAGHRVELFNEIRDDLEIACDPSRMIQVFVNLIRNAVHALRNIKDVDGKIHVSANPEVRDDGHWIVISVQDNGPGIDPAMVDSLFEPFVSSRLDSQGTGLGLAVAEGIIREHGGMVVPSNVVGLDDSGIGLHQGAKFEVHLPVASIQS